MKLIFFFFISLFSCGLLAAENLSGEHVKISWLAPKVFGANETETIAIHFKLDPEWHVYWKNPGDSGAAPKFNFVEKNAELGPIQWPIPRRIPVAHLVNIGYEKSVGFLFSLTPNATDSAVKLVVKLEWLVCKEECIPGFGELTLDRPIRPGASVWVAKDKKIRDQFLLQVPARQGSPWLIDQMKVDDGNLKVRLKSIVQVNDSNIEIFPVDGEFVMPQFTTIEKQADGFDITFGLAAGRTLPEELTFAVTDKQKKSWYISAPVGKSLPAVSDSASKSASVSLAALLFFAFLGGIILNLMPCVLPVLSIKFLSLLNSSQDQRRKEALLYLSGVVTTFFVLGAVFLILRAFGAAIGWGFQLQSPLIVFFLVLLFWFMSLNFLGLFEFGDSVANFAGRSQSGGSFVTGILAVFVAAPCTGPFMGTALGAAAVLPAAQALGIFVSLGLGLGFPFVLGAYVPAFQRILPKPGAWMETLKQFLAFPLLATVIWLTWVLGIQIGSDGWLLVSVVLLVASFGLWLVKQKVKYFKWLGGIVIGLSIALAFQFLLGITKNNSSTSVELSKHSNSSSQALKTDFNENPNLVEWLAYDRDVLDKARAAGKFVFVDFTAAWCITCQVNKKTVLETEAVTKVFKENSVVLLRADWTNQDPLITQALAEFDRNSVPVYLFYGADGSPAQVLPQILTKTLIQNLFNKKE